MSLPDGLKQAAAALRLEGSVEQRNRDGSTRIRTDQGPVDVQIRGRQPQAGQRLELELPAGNPPRTATIRPAAPPPPQQQQPPAQAQPQAEAATPSPPRTAPASPPAQPSAPQAPAQAPPNASAPEKLPQYQPSAESLARLLASGGKLPPLQAGQNIRLLPAPPNYQPLPAPPVHAQAPGQGTDTAPQPASLSDLRQALQALRLNITVQNTLSAMQSEIAQLSARTPLPLTAHPTAATPWQMQGAASPLSASLGATALASPGASGASSASGVSGAAASAFMKAGPPSFIAALFGGGQALQSTAAAPLPATLLTTGLGAMRLPAGQMDVRLIGINSPAAQLTGAAGMTPQGTGIGTSAQSPQPNAQIPLFLSAENRAFLLRGVVTGFTPQNQAVISLTAAAPNPAGAAALSIGALTGMAAHATPAAPASPASMTMLMPPHILQFSAGNLLRGSELFFLPQNAILTTSLPAPSAGAASLAGAGLTPSGAAGLHSTSLFRALPPMMQPLPHWPVIEEILQSLHGGAVLSAATAATRGATPSLSNPAQLGAAALLFIAAVRAGDLQSWFGDKRLEQLQKLQKTGLLQRLSAESSAGARTTPTADNSGEWRSYPVPLLWQNEVAKIMLHLKHEDRPPDDGQEGGQTRFIMDLALTRMGDIQLDGLLRDRRLDLIVRTATPISMAMQQAMKTAYANALESTDIHGDLGFQGDMRHWIQVVKRAEGFGASA